MDQSTVHCSAWMDSEGGSVMQYFLPPDFCQSSIDGCDGSLACCIMAVKAAAYMVSHDLGCPTRPGEIPQDSIYQNISAMKRGK